MWRRLAGLMIMAGMIGLPGSGFAQDDSAAPDNQAAMQAVDEARRSNPALVVRTDPVTGLPTSVRGLRLLVDPDVALGASATATGRPSKDDVRLAAEAFFNSGELSAAFSTRNARTKVEALRVRNDPNIPGQSIVQVEQRVDGVPVFGSSARVVVGPSLAVTQLTAKFSNVNVEVTTPAITVDAAASIARDRLHEILAKDRADPSLDRLRDGLDNAPIETALVIYDPALMRAGS